MSVRRFLLPALTAALIAGPLGSTAAWASFRASASLPSAVRVTSATVAAPGNLTGTLDCTTGAMSATWTVSGSPGVTGYRMTAQFNKGPDQVTLLPPTATSWSGWTDPSSVVGPSSKVQYIVTTLTSYGWTADATFRPLSC